MPVADSFCKDSHRILNLKTNSRAASFIDHITEYLTDENRRLSTKAAFVILALFMIVLVDNILGFSFHYRTDKKLEELQKVAGIINDTSADRTTKAYAAALRSEIMDRQNIIDYSLSFLRNIKWASSKSDHTSKTIAADKTKDVPIKNDILFKFTVSGLYIIAGLIFIPIVLILDKKSPLHVRIASGLAAGFIIVMFSSLFNWLFGFIPILSKTTWAWNYGLNFVVQAIILFSFVMHSMNANKS
ncbi:hypothetical protein OCK74_01600 [Chitinophagaceae bacterium LB-8]|uniref:Uncharacterized protein n=1 Tax=Paraflavisolibacter caeni TaxID=2982496 RepID=A0A9X2XNA4_9BACT|nr:hypothetical protein [Paraflavisolibacter caeni]MCU7547784.1 hypothetical protein [Paraflavisolibacter caeni]